MKKHIALIGLLLVLSGSNALAQHTHVHGYYRRSTGTYVLPHYRTAPDHSRLNNWSTKGNYNPFTGKGGSEEPLGRKIRKR
ncbi:MAG TPA: hypothetical protein VGM92_10390 [Candidatus Kapabacteria bacterium]|jgi:hypothetical protein